MQNASNHEALQSMFRCGHLKQWNGYKSMFVRYLAHPCKQLQNSNQYYLLTSATNTIATKTIGCWRTLNSNLYRLTPIPSLETNHARLLD
jgi:hypothetical protein